MTDAEKREAARQFYYKWNKRGKEDEDDRSYWIDFLQDVMGIDHVTDRIDFQKKVVGPDGNTKKIDAYIPETKVLIEQKSLGIALDKPQSGHGGMTPYEQAKMYDNSLPHSEKAKWIVLSNFAEIWVYDMDERVPTPEKFLLDDIPTKFSKFEFLVNSEQKVISKEMEVSVKAGELVGRIYDAFYKQYINPENEESLKSLNMLCVRLVFCLYAEDAHIFGSSGHMFKDYLGKFETKDMRKALIELFKILDTKPEDRDPYDTSALAKFPYVNGGLFADENIEIPHFTDEIREVLLSNASDGFDWSMISPTIFGAVFESTLNPETRRSGGMHYTSIENIHKVIDPLFLDELNEEFEEIMKKPIAGGSRTKALEKFQDKLAGLKFLDPACGSGNFLTETFLSIRRLENKIIKELNDDFMSGQMSMFTTAESLGIKVSINQFYGIEINDFAVTVAKTALWIAESQTMKETEDIMHMELDFLPLKTNAYIVEGNALRIDWDDVISNTELNYIMGNPPFVGFTYMTDDQKKDMSMIFHGVKNLDLVCGWYKKANDFIKNTKINCGFVSTNSIAQGETVSRFWKFVDFKINFAYQSFVWNSEANAKAHVHCVIIGFADYNKDKKRLFYDNKVEDVDNINQYLVNAPNTIVESRNKPICNVSKMVYGNKPADGGYLIIEDADYNDFVTRDPESIKFIRPLMGAVEFLNNKKRWCLWLDGESPNEIKKCPLIMERIEKCKRNRAASKAEGIRKFAKTPTLFAQITQPRNVDYILIPRVSSERRIYIPMAFLTSETIVTDAVQIVPNATMYEFGILNSNVHMAWMRAVCGRLESRYRYSKDVVYNNFPWPNPTVEQREQIKHTAQGILDARAMYPDCTLAELYDPNLMPRELDKAHNANNRAVMNAYGFNVKNMSEEICVAELMKLYQKLTSK